MYEKFIDEKLIKLNIIVRIGRCPLLKLKRYHYCSFLCKNELLAKVSLNFENLMITCFVLV